MSMSSMGVGSGLDIRAIVDQLVAAERAPTANRLDRRERDVQTELSAYGKVRSALSAFQQQIGRLSNVDSFRAMNATSSNEDALGVSTAKDAASGRYDISIANLAQSQSLASAGFESRTEIVGGGSLTFTFGTIADDGDGLTFARDEERATHTIEVGENATLNDIRNAINEADIGVQASIINDGSSERLVLAGQDEGAASGFTIDVAADGGSRLNELAFDPEADDNPVDMIRRAEDAVLTINGLQVTRSSNDISDAIEGVTLNLKETTTANVRVDINRDTDAVVGQVQAFVESFNALQTELNDLTRYNTLTEQAGPLLGNATVRGINTQLRGLLTNPVQALEGNEVRSLADLGIMTKRDGTLEYDSGRLRDALEANFEQVGALFNSMGLTGDAEGVEYLGSDSATQAGNYRVRIDQHATQASLSGGAFTAGTVAAGANRFRIEVDGTRSGHIEITPREYASGHELAVELQERINADSVLQGKDATVRVRYVDGQLQITSQRWGSDSSVRIDSGDNDMLALMGFDAGALPEAVHGQDVQGTIDGIAAEGKGRELIATEGRAEGLRLQIESGDGGTVTFSRGILEALEDAVESYLGSSGLLSNTTDRLNDNLKDIERNREQLALRLERVEARYMAQFTAMDALIAQMNQSSQFLQQQLSALPGVR